MDIIECSDQPLDVAFHPTRESIVAAALVDGTLEGTYKYDVVCNMSLTVCFHIFLLRLVVLASTFFFLWVDNDIHMYTVMIFYESIQSTDSSNNTEITY